MELISITSEPTWLKVVLLIGGLVSFFGVIWTGVGLFVGGTTWKNNRKDIIGFIVTVVLLLGCVTGFSQLEDYTLYHYLIEDYDELDSKLETHRIYSKVGNIYKLVQEDDR